jgi:hypothetical protein
VPFRPRLRAEKGVSGLFWLMPESWQHDRIRQLARTLSPETISTIARRSVRDVLLIIEATSSV